MARQNGNVIVTGMPRFYLHLHNMVIDTNDGEGSDLPDLAAARVQAIAGIRDFIAHEAMKGELDFRGHVNIADDKQATLATIPFVDAFTIKGL